MLTAFAALTAGVALARLGRYETHRWVQTAAVALTFVPIGGWMLGSLGRNIVPYFPADLRYGAFAMSAVHVVLGAVAAVVGVLVVARATQLDVTGRSLAVFRTPMRVAYLLYLIAVTAGVTVYVVTYG